MFIYTAKLPRRSPLAAALLAAALLALLSRCAGGREAPPSLAAPDNDARLAYLASLGWEARAQPLEELELTLPSELEEPYLSYNAVQLRQGFDLAPYCGRTLLRCTYALTNYPGREQGVQADLYVCDGVIVAGDVVCVGENGFLTTLERPQHPG